MGLRFSRRITLLPGVHLNLGLKSVSLSLGPRGAGVTLGPGGVHGHLGLPGTGLSYRKRLAGGQPRGSQAPEGIRIRFDGLNMLIGDETGAALEGGVLLAARKAFRQPILDALDVRAAELNTDRMIEDVPDVQPDGSHAGLSQLETRLSAIRWPRETLVTLDADGAVLRADVDLPEIEDLPDASVAVARRELALVARPLSPAARRRAYERHICDVACRIIDEAFAADPACTEVQVAGYTQRPSDGTGDDAGDLEDVYVLAAVVPRDLWGADPDPVARLAPFRRRSARDAHGDTHPVVPLARA